MFERACLLCETGPQKEKIKCIDLNNDNTKATGDLIAYQSLFFQILHYLSVQSMLPVEIKKKRFQPQNLRQKSKASSPYATTISTIFSDLTLAGYRKCTLCVTTIDKRQLMRGPQLRAPLNLVARCRKLHRHLFCRSATNGTRLAKRCALCVRLWTRAGGSSRNAGRAEPRTGVKSRAA